MPEPGQAPTVETQLAEMDRRLRELQAELAPDVEQAAEAQRSQPAADAPPAPEAAAPTTPPPVQQGEPIREPPQPPPPTQVPPPPPREQPSPAPQPPPVSELPPIRPSAAHEARGRAGPLATLLQRSPRRDVSAQQVEMLAVLSDRLLASLRELLGGYEVVVAGMQPQAPNPPGPPLAAQPPQELTLSAGPFRSTVALRGFQRTIASLPGVSEVSVREYEGYDRAILHVQLDDRTA